MVLRNTIWSLIGLVIPTLVAIPAMSYMARVLEPEKFGLFMLAFSVVGYASIFDAGLTRAVIRAIAMNNGNKEADRQVLGTSTWVVFGLSVFASSLLYIFSSQLVHFFNVSPAVVIDANYAFKCLALVIPPLLVSLIWFAYLEGRQMFKVLSHYKAVTGGLVALFPVLALMIYRSLESAIIGLLVARIVGLVISYIPCRKDLGSRLFGFDLGVLKELFHFGSWITVSNIVNPIMGYADRFLLSHFIGAQRVAFYAAPADVVARMSIVPGALARVLFPLLSHQKKEAKALSSNAYKGLLAVVLLMVLPIFVFAPFLLTLWLGERYADESSNILRILLIGFVFNSLAQIPFTHLQAHGKSRLTAMINLFELFPYLGALVLLVQYFGLTGAAIAWTLRVSIDMGILIFFAKSLRVD